MSEQEFPEIHWNKMRNLMVADGPQAVIEFIRRFESDLQRRQLFSLAHQGLGQREWDGKNFDALITVVEAGMAEGLRAAEAASDDESRNKRIDYANVLAFNLAADLAECWPGDESKRERRHFEKGVALGQQCLSWREKLSKGPGPFSMAHWVKGMHHLSLGQMLEAEADFASSLEHAIAAAQEQDKPIDCSGGGDFSVLLGHGYLGLARRERGDAEGEALYRGAIKAFTETVAEYPELKDDAQFGLDQLREVDRILTC
jgi:hypothetical protein